MSQFKVDPARVMFEGADFVLYDVSDLLPRHKNFPHGTDVIKPNGRRAIPSNWCYRQVPNRKVEILYCHQTAGSVTYDGFEALKNTYQFQVNDPAYTLEGKWTGRGRGWPSGCYTYYIPYNPILWKKKIVIFVCWDHDWVTWHSSHNANSEAIVCQGYFKHRSMKKFKPKKGCPHGSPSEAQQIALVGFINEYALGEMKLDRKNIKGHCDSPRPKIQCPGDDIEKLYRDIQKKVVEVTDDFDPPTFLALPGMVELDTWEERQAALVLLGHHLGHYGPKNNGVDGDAGDLTRMAVETEEMNLGLKVDGYWDDIFDYHVKVQLLARGLGKREIDELLP
jgi:hypothetical protein